jgi:prophage regulatory protein
MEPTRILKLPEVSRRTGYSRSSLYAKVNKNNIQYDPMFPRPINLGARSVGWSEAEVEAWLQTRIASRDTP